MKRHGAADQMGRIKISRSAKSEVGGRRSEIPKSEFRIPNRFRPLHLLGIVFLLFVVSGCEDGIDATYGQRTGLGADSVNGTAVLASMFQQAGHQVSTASRLAPKLQKKADVIVWFPNDFQPPTPAVRNWFKAWWLAAPGRTLIYVGRDFDAAPGYWRAMQAGAPAEQLPEIKRRLAKAKSEFLLERSKAPDDADGDWFVVKGKSKSRKVKTVSGGPEWVSGIDASKLDIELNGRIVPSAGAQVVLRDRGDMLVSREMMHGGKLIVVVNGSFLLNLPLVNHEHRKLAAKLIAEVGANRQVAFLESEAGGPTVFDEDPPDTPRGDMEIFGIAPFNSILLHLAFAGMILCAARFPIFGRPRELPPPRLSDFGRHVWALGQMLQRTKDRAYALGRVLHYQQNSRRDATRHRPPPTAPREQASPGDE
jgi:uncharacterized protein DUF4350